MDLSINIENVTSTVVAAVILIVLTKIGSWAWSWANKLYAKLTMKQHTKVPPSLTRTLRHLVMLSCLLYMLVRTAQLTSPVLASIDVVLLAGWTWAVLSYLQHIWRSRTVA